MQGNPQHALKNNRVIDSGCSRHMTGNMSYLSDFEDLNGGYVTFGGNPKGGKISGKGSGPTWLFDIDTLTKTMNYQPVTAGNQSKPSAGVQEQFDAEKAREENNQQYVLFLFGLLVLQILITLMEMLPLMKRSLSLKEGSLKFEDFSDNSINEDNAAGTLVPAVGQLSLNNTNTFSTAGPSTAAAGPTQGKSSYAVGVKADFNNLETSITVSPIPTRVHKDHHVTEIISDLSSATQTRSITRVAKDQGGLSQINNDDFHTCMFVCFLLQEEPKRVFKNKKDEQGIGVRNKTRLIAQGHTHEEGIDYKEVFAPVARIEAIRLFLAYASFMGFMVYQMDVKSAFLYGTINEEVYVCQPIGFEDPDYPDKVYKVVKALYGLHQAPRAWGTHIIFRSLSKAEERWDIYQQDKYVAEILRKFGLTDRKSASTPIDTEKPLLKDPNGEDLDVHTYRSMIGSLMYLTSSRPDIMFAVCACAHFQVTPKASHLHAVKRIFRYLKGKPYLGLWYLKDSPFDLVAYSDSDYAGASLDRKSTT
nr:retrovirus-related Pol polyprotein from transposon TNT 1-94 [Tanacetum cinerariifolium]